MQQTFANRYGENLIKDQIHCLLWKDPMRVSNYVQNNHIDLVQLCDQYERLRFLMPIRNPLDCAISNTKTGHARHLVSGKIIEIKQILERILREIAWFIGLNEVAPDRFFYFFENEFNRSTLLNLAKFLNVDPSKEWIEDAINCYNLKEPYEYDPHILDHYKKSLDIYMERHGEEKEKLIAFAAN